MPNIKSILFAQKQKLFSISRRSFQTDLLPEGAKAYINGLFETLKIFLKKL
jgi:hypothetical protein